MTMSFITSQLVVEHGGGAPFVAYAYNHEKAKITSDIHPSDDPWAALHDLTRGLCRHCHKAERKHGDKYCQPCALAIITHLGRIGWLTRRPKNEAWFPRDPVGRFSAGSEGSWENAVRAYEEAR